MRGAVTFAAFACIGGKEPSKHANAMNTPFRKTHPPEPAGGGPQAPPGGAADRGRVFKLPMEPFFGYLHQQNAQEAHP